MAEKISFTLNGRPKTVETDGGRALLWVVRTELGLTGAKYGCGEGLCGSCTVLMDGRAVRSCITPVRAAAGTEIVTIEGLAAGGELHPVQQAFMEQDALQCGYCTPGMIMQAASLLNENPDPSEADIIAALEDNLCRCGAHNRIIAAVRTAASRMKGGS
jgi:carbon-monoxide dehydrogenase small subunit